VPVPATFLATVPPARVLLASLPPLLADVVRAVLADDGDVEVVGEIGTGKDDGARLADAVAGSRADVVITGADGAALSEPFRSLMYRFPLVHVLSMSPDGRAAAVWRLVPEGRRLEEVSALGLADALRAMRAVAG
jgi:DNA-binding NarL/FixJ family response regulator